MESNNFGRGETMSEIEEKTLTVKQAAEFLHVKACQ